MLHDNITLNIHVSYIPKEQITSFELFLNERLKDIVAVPMTHQTHCIKTNGKQKLMAALGSTFFLYS